MTWHLVPVAAAVLVGCGSSSQPAHPSDGNCDPPCHGHDAGPPDAMVVDAGGDSGAEASDLALFLGHWSPASGSGETDCGGQITSAPPDPSAVLAFAPSGPGALVATSSGAKGCALSLTVDGDTAVLAHSPEVCSVAGSSVAFTTFTLVFAPAGVDGGTHAPDAASLGDTLDWQLTDTDGTCVTTLHYTLVRH